MKRKKKNLLENKIVFRIACVLGYFLVKALCGSVRVHEYNKEGFDSLLEKGGLCFLWHRTLMISIYANRYKNISTLAALSPDGSVQAYICEKLGYNCYRGSTKRHGVLGLFQIMKGLKRGEFVAVTVDGPIGPAEKCQPGAVAMIKKTGLPYIAVGVAINRKWVFEKSWDKHTLPKPKSDTVIYYSDPIYTDEEKSDEEILAEIERNINKSAEKAQQIIKEKFNG
ncbi:MAG: DUF374 domain-containing protein [Armatimonadetes bacterium]|nr:DUF374 domain-containing protein [Candidatus Hippobium faecium]